MREGRNASKNVTGSEAHGDAVRVVDNDSTVDSKAQGGGRRPPGFKGSLRY
jgi:hypothetical protein